MKLNEKDLLKAYQTIGQYIDPSPLVLNDRLSKKYGCKIYLKLENLLPVGSFKMRGAINKIASLNEKDRARGVVAVSAGNHAQGVAWAASLFGVKATIFMPEGSPLTKINKTQEMGAEVILAGLNVEETFEAAREFDKKHNMVFIHPFEDELVVAGQASIAYELLGQLEDFDYVVGSIGGGGLMTGVGTVLKRTHPDTQIIGAQASGASSMIESLKNGKLISHDKSRTFCDGIKVKTTSKKMFPLLKELIDIAVDVDDERIALALLELMEKAHIITEGAGSLPLAAFDKLYKKNPNKFRDKKVVLIICGGNIDINLLGKIIDKGLIKSHRRVRLSVQINDRPGALSKLTGLVSSLKGNILQVEHDNEDPHTSLLETTVDMTIETKGKEHQEKILQALREDYPRISILD